MIGKLTNDELEQMRDWHALRGDPNAISYIDQEVAWRKTCLYRLIKWIKEKST